MTIPTAVLLAAGRGNRLGLPIPKGLLQIEGQQLALPSIEMLRASGVHQLVVVVGFASQYYEAALERQPGVTLIHNTIGGSGSMDSLALAADAVDGPFLLLESDLVYEARALTVLQRGEAQDTILCSATSHIDDEVWVQDRGGRLAGMSKDRSLLASPCGVLVGISLISRLLLQRMVTVARPGMDYEQALVLAAQTRPVTITLIEDLIWAEVDHEEHLMQAMVRPRRAYGLAAGAPGAGLHRAHARAGHCPAARSRGTTEVRTTSRPWPAGISVPYESRRTPLLASNPGTAARGFADAGRPGASARGPPGRDSRQPTGAGATKGVGGHRRGQGGAQTQLLGMAAAQSQDDRARFAEKLATGKAAAHELMVIALIESLVVGSGMTDALSRAQAYVAAGADAVMIHSRRPSPDEVLRFARDFHQEFPDTPLVAVPTAYPSVCEATLASAGFSMVIYANQLSRAAYPAMLRAASTILAQGRAQEAEPDLIPVAEFLRVIPGNVP